MKCKCVSWRSLQWATFISLVFMGNSSWVHRNFIQLVTSRFSPAVLSLQIQWSQGAKCTPGLLNLVLSSVLVLKNPLWWNPYFQGLKNMFQRRQTSLMFCRAEEGFILNTTLASCFPVAPVQEHICRKHSASIFCAKFCIRLKINGNSEVGWESRLIWQSSWEANREGI